MESSIAVSMKKALAGFTTISSATLKGICHQVLDPQVAESIANHILSSLPETFPRVSIFVDGNGNDDALPTTRSLMSSVNVERDISPKQLLESGRIVRDSPLAVEANFPLFIIYTSGSTGKPKGIVHAHGYISGVMMTM